MLGRSFYVLYGLRRGNRASRIITWAAALFVVAFWAWRFTVSPSPLWE